MPAARRIDPSQGKAGVDAALAALERAQAPARADMALAVRYLLEEISLAHPGNSVEIRVPPWGVTQCVEGPRHTRGTPPNVVEMSPEVFLSLASGRGSWEEHFASGALQASGSRADVSALFPLF